MTTNNVAMWCGYAVMVIASAAIVLFGLYAIATSVNEIFAEYARAARQTYWWSRWIRFHRIAQARKGTKL